MATTNLGKVSVTPKGEYDPLVTYERLDVISHNGSSYIVKQASTGVTPIEGEFYALIAEKGDGGSFLEKSYKTYAAMELDKPNLTANISTRVSNDSDATKNGSYTYDGTVFTRSQYDSKVVTDKIIADTAIAVQDAINNTAVEGGVLADTFVTATISAVDSVARTQRDVNSDYLNINSFYKSQDAGDYAIALGKALAAGQRVRFPYRKEPYQIRTRVDYTAVGDISLDLGGSVLDVVDGAAIRIKGADTDPFLTTTATSDLMRNNTFFTCANVIGVARGDLVRITSTVTWMANTPLTQYYVVQDIDEADGKVYVSGVIVGEISTAQYDVAGVGAISVDFYKIPYNLEVFDGKILSSDRSGATGLLSLSMFHAIYERNLILGESNRSVLVQNGNGYVFGNNITVEAAGYVIQDGGYSSKSYHPDGLGYGYGSLVTNGYAAIYTNCNSYNSWHGFDFATGLCVGIIDNCTAHKDALAWSSHEGQWTFIIKNSKTLGGGAIITRSCDLYVLDNEFDTSLGRTIIGNASHQNLIIKRNNINCGGGALIYLTDEYNVKAYDSNIKPVCEVEDNTLRDVGGVSYIRVRGGSVKLRRNTVERRFEAIAHLQIICTSIGEVDIYDNTFENSAQQYNIVVSGETSIINLQRNTSKVKSKIRGAMLYVPSGQHAELNILHNTMLAGNELVRIDVAIDNISSVGNYAPLTNFGLFQEGATAKISANNVFSIYPSAVSKITLPASYNDVFLNRTSPNREVTEVYDFPSLEGGATQTKDTTLSGVSVGDIVAVSFSRVLQGTMLWAEVTAADTVTIYHHNPTDIAVDVASGTLKIRVL